MSGKIEWIRAKKIDIEKERERRREQKEVKWKEKRWIGKSKEKRYALSINDSTIARYTRRCILNTIQHFLALVVVSTSGKIATIIVSQLGRSLFRPNRYLLNYFVHSLNDSGLLQHFTFDEKINLILLLRRRVLTRYYVEMYLYCLS